MCAINGVTKNDEALVERMNEATRHRGPDGSRIWSGNGITFGHNRLAIIDLSDAALQPMKSTDGRYVIVFNGEIYNYRELRAELENGYTFTTQSDTEVLIAAYAKWGEGMFLRLRGIFAFAIWDTKQESLLLARDHIGVKPLYYQFQDTVLSFSSEIVGLIKEDATLDEEALSLYIELGYVPSPKSFLSDIKKLQPGHLIRYQNGKITEVTYYDPMSAIGIPNSDYGVKATSHDDLRRTIDTGVKRQLVSDRPVGMFLSGGIDSSVVLHHMAQHTNNVRTFSVDFEMVKGAEGEAKKFNTDAELASRTAKIYGATHKTFTLTMGDIRENLETSIQALDEPVANPTAISQYLLSKWVRADGVVVALGGDGGDELFGGYTRHRMAMAGYYFQKLPLPVRKLIGNMHGRIDKLNTSFPVPMHLMLMANKEAVRHKIFKENQPLYETTEKFFTNTYERVVNGFHPVDTFMRIDRETWLPDESLSRSDRSSMAHGLELRVPLLDLDVVTYADAIPVAKKTDPWKGKKILRNAYRGQVPDYIFNQPKRGWISPGAKWLRDPVIQVFAKEVLSPHYYDGFNELFNWPVIEKMLSDHIDKRGYYLFPLWNIMVLQIWARKQRVTSKEL